MAKNKFLVFLRMKWVTFLLIFLAIFFVTTVTFLIVNGFSNFANMESFSRKQLTAQMGMYLIMGIIQAVIYVGLFGLMQYYTYMGGGISKMLGGDSAQKAKSDVKWEDVVGMEAAKRDAWEIVQFIKDANKLKAIGGSMIKGVLFIGSPGCGKTYLAKAMAHEAGLPFLSATGSDFVGMIVGLGAVRMKSLFKKARELADLEGGCIIFIDEIDSFAMPRTDEKGFGGQSSQNATINQFLTELDGMRKKENNIVVFAATNYPPEKLDSAIMRSGRFDRKIYFEKPTAEERISILKFYLSKVNAASDIDLALIADRCQIFSPADINNMVREASILALRQNRPQVTNADLLKAINDLMVTIERSGGEEKILTGKVNVHWDDVIGMESAKREAKEIVELLKDRNKLKAVGGRIIKGVMMFGPPGCGKTYLAKAMATESGFPFISKTGTEFIEQFVGVGPRRVRDLFKEARTLAKSENGCIIFIDEIDAIAKPRSFGSDSYGGPTEYNATINQLLTEMDGLKNENSNIIILGATNAPESALDSALMRAGRFDRKIYVNLPNLEERTALFKFYLSRVMTDGSCDAAMLARKAVYFSPSQIESMVREAGIFALRDGRETITFKDLSNAYDRIQYGDKSNIMMSDEEKLWTAYHEAGHAIIGYILHPTDDVIKATIIPRKGSLGMVSSRPPREFYSHTKEKLLADIKVDLAAYVAERIKFGSTSSGVGGGQGSDFDQAMHLAYTMVWSLGMGKSGMVGDFQMLRTRQGAHAVSERTKQTLDEDVQDILQGCIKEVEKILGDHKDLLDEFSQQLLQKGELEYDEIEMIFKKFNVKPLYRPPVQTS